MDINFNETRLKLSERLGWWSVVLSLRVNNLVYTKLVVCMCAFSITIQGLQQKVEQIFISFYFFFPIRISMLY